MKTYPPCVVRGVPLAKKPQKIAFSENGFAPVFECFFDLVEELVGDGAVYHAIVIGIAMASSTTTGRLNMFPSGATRIFRPDSCQGDLDDLPSECRSNAVPTCRECRAGTSQVTTTGAFNAVSSSVLMAQCL